MPRKYTPFVSLTCGTCGVQFFKQFRIETIRYCSRSCTSKATKFRHGESRPSSKTPEYEAWIAIKTRCLKPTSRTYIDYGARGITICDRWNASYPAFLEDVGRRPSPVHSIGRIDNDGNYEPGNVRWATRREQAGNKRTTHWLSFNGETRCLDAWARHVGINRATLRARLKMGWSLERALTAPPDKTARVVAHCATPSDSANP